MRKTREAGLMGVCGLALVAGQAAAVEPVVRLTGPQQIGWDGTRAFTAFSNLSADGTAFGWSFVPPGEGRLFRVLTDGTELLIGSGGNLGFHDVSPDGRWALGSGTSTYSPGECSFQGNGSSTRPLLFDVQTGETRYFTELCPNFLTMSITNDARTAVGGLSRGERSVGDIFDAAIWNEGQITLLERPDFGASLADRIDSFARSVSGNGTVVAGNAVLTERLPAELPVSEAIRWVDGVPEVLEHFPSVDADAQTSFGYLISGDGSVFYGSTTDWTFDGTRWFWTDQTFWIDRDGTKTDLGVSSQSQWFYGTTRDGSLLFGADFASPESAWRGIVWSVENGLEPADTWISRLGIDLDRQPIRQVFDVSPEGDWMLVTLAVDEANEQYARIRVPCSAADLTADRVIALDDLLAYAERFVSGNALADLSGDGLLDLADIVAFLTLYAAGCPD